MPTPYRLAFNDLTVFLAELAGMSQRLEGTVTSLTRSVAFITCPDVDHPVYCPAPVLRAVGASSGTLISFRLRISDRRRPQAFEVSLVDMATLVQRVKDRQRTGEDEREQWRHYCRSSGHSIFDPRRHEASFLQGFFQFVHQQENEG